MAVSGKQHAPAALTTDKDPVITTGYENGLDFRNYLDTGEKWLPLPSIEPSTALSGEFVLSS
jgi:hypothetical protein